MAIRIVTDTCSDLTNEDLGKGNYILPIPVYIDGKEYIPFVNLSPSEFYPLQEKAKEAPHTSAIPLNMAIDTFKKILLEGDQVVAIFMGSKHSSSYNVACLAKDNIVESLGEQYENSIFIIDSQNVTFPEAALVLEAKRLVEEGKMSASEIASRIEYLVPRIHMRAFIADLFFLKKFGRISAVAATFGTLMNFKVVISTGQNEIKVVSKERGVPRALHYILETAKSEEIDTSLPTYVGYTYDKTVAEKLMEVIESNSEFRPKKIIEIGATVGAHVGPGSTGFCWFTK